MLDRLAQFLDISTTAAGLVVVLIAVQITTQVYALVDLARRDTVRSGRKWVWALVIVFGNLVGAIVYLAVGRTPDASGSSTDSRASTAGGEAARRAVDTLYGPQDRC